MEPEIEAEEDVYYLPKEVCQGKPATKGKIIQVRVVEEADESGQIGVVPLAEQTKPMREDEMESVGESAFTEKSSY